MYKPSLLFAEPGHQHLAKGFVVGMRFHSAPVIRLADAKPVRLGDTTKADGRWRIFAFADRAVACRRAPLACRALCDFLADAPSVPGPAIHAAASRYRLRDRCPGRVPARPSRAGPRGHASVPLPTKGRYGLRDYEKIFCPDLKSSNDIFDMRGIDRDRGCVVVVRPDQYVATCAPARRLCRPFGLLRWLHAAALLSTRIYLRRPKKAQHLYCRLGNRNAKASDCFGCRSAPPVFRSSLLSACWNLDQICKLLFRKL